LSNISFCSSVSSLNSSYLYPVNPIYHLPTTSITPVISFSANCNINHVELENTTKEILRKEEMKRKAYKNSRSSYLIDQPNSLSNKNKLNSIDSHNKSFNDYPINNKNKDKDNKDNGNKITKSKNKNINKRKSNNISFMSESENVNNMKLSSSQSKRRGVILYIYIKKNFF